ncbi:PH domain-containing protein [Ferruginibacter paludis]|uniref:PH domain-containing protein n=1 Tax=Ferruginibacter paludis TaxID=1310417 RepID=UPI0025B3B98C|nr:PH domain-containing protein [Ferruginibacter paludis]MDN3656429.1 PH domain-containing protein [Ferruginibacter paludis]
MRTALKKDEKILLITRQHWIKMVLPIFVWLLIAVLAIWLIDTTGLIITLVAALYPMYEYLTWKSNLWCVTNLRVVDESGFFSRYSKESPLDKINNVEYDQSIWGRLFGYGNVDIQTAAELGETTYELIQEPKLLKDTITHAQEEYKKSGIMSQAALLAKAITDSTATVKPSQQMIADELTKLFDLLQKGAITQDEYLHQKSRLMR